MMECAQEPGSAAGRPETLTLDRMSKNMVLLILPVGQWKKSRFAIMNSIQNKPSLQERWHG